jgi:hypothetical protein
MSLADNNTVKNQNIQLAFEMLLRRTDKLEKNEFLNFIQQYKIVKNDSEIFDDTFIDSNIMDFKKSDYRN